MKPLIRIAAFALVLLPAIVAAQEPQQHPMAGYWSGVMSEGGAEVSLDLRVQGDVVTGPIATANAGDLYIRNGSVTGNTIQFTSPSLDPAQNVPLVWTGQLTGNNEIAFQVAPESGEAPAREVVVTKQAAHGGR